jgi:hypothetical protein
MDYKALGKTQEREADKNAQNKSNDQEQLMWRTDP